jgi:hypothetical protein
MYHVRDVRCPVVVGGYLVASLTHFEIKDSDERGTTVEHRTWRSGYNLASPEPVREHRAHDTPHLPR